MRKLEIKQQHGNVTPAPRKSSRNASGSLGRRFKQRRGFVGTWKTLTDAHILAEYASLASYSYLWLCILLRLQLHQLLGFGCHSHQRDSTQPQQHENVHWYIDGETIRQQLHLRESARAVCTCQRYFAQKLRALSGVQRNISRCMSQAQVHQFNLWQPEPSSSVHIACVWRKARLSVHERAGGNRACRGLLHESHNQWRSNSCPVLYDPSQRIYGQRRLRVVYSILDPGLFYRSPAGKRSEWASCVRFVQHHEADESHASLCRIPWLPILNFVLPVI